MTSRLLVMVWRTRTGSLKVMHCSLHPLPSPGSPSLSSPGSPSPLQVLHPLPSPGSPSPPQVLHPLPSPCSSSPPQVLHPLPSPGSPSLSSRHPSSANLPGPSWPGQMKCIRMLHTKHQFPTFQPVAILTSRWLSSIMVWNFGDTCTCTVMYEVFVYRYWRQWMSLTYIRH